MEKYDERIKEIDDAIEKLQIEKHQLRIENSGYFIGVKYVGDSDYWDEYLIPLGRITEAEAYEWVEDNNDYCGPDYWMGTTPPYFKVNHEDYRKYQFLANLKLICGPVPDKYGKDIGSINTRILEIREELYEELGIENSSYIHV